MLRTEELQTLAAHVGEHVMEAHRGAVRLGRGGSVVVFFNDGGHAEPRGRAAARDLDPDADGFARLQRGIARGVTAGVTLAHAL